MTVQMMTMKTMIMMTRTIRDAQEGEAQLRWVAGSVAASTAVAGEVI